MLIVSLPHCMKQLNDIHCYQVNTNHVNRPYDALAVLSISVTSTIKMYKRAPYYVNLNACLLCMTVKVIDFKSNKFEFIINHTNLFNIYCIRCGLNKIRRSNE